MTHVAMTSPLAPVVAAVEGLRRRHPALLDCIAPGLVITPTGDWETAINAEAAAVLLVAGWTRARRVPLLIRGETYVDRAGRLGVRRALVAVLAGDPAAGHPGVIVARDRAGLLDLVHRHVGGSVPGPEFAHHLRCLTALWSGDIAWRPGVAAPAPPR